MSRRTLSSVLGDERYSARIVSFDDLTVAEADSVLPEACPWWKESRQISGHKYILKGNFAIFQPIEEKIGIARGVRQLGQGDKILSLGGYHLALELVIVLVCLDIALDIAESDVHVVVFQSNPGGGRFERLPGRLKKLVLSDRLTGQSGDGALLD